MHWLASLTGMVSLIVRFLTEGRAMYPPGGYEMVSSASRGRKGLACCEHQSTPVLVSAIPDGYRAQCLVCGTRGPVREDSRAARLGLLGGRDERS
jgi:hypothetical protein